MKGFYTDVYRYHDVYFSIHSHLNLSNTKDYYGKIYPKK